MKSCTYISHYKLIESSRGSGLYIKAKNVCMFLDEDPQHTDQKSSSHYKAWHGPACNEEHKSYKSGSISTCILTSGIWIPHRSCMSISVFKLSIFYALFSFVPDIGFCHMSREQYCLSTLSYCTVNHRLWRQCLTVAATQNILYNIYHFRSWALMQ